MNNKGSSSHNSLLSTMESSLQRTPSKITNAYLKLQMLLHEIEAQIVQFTDLPIDTPGLDLLARDIAQKFVFSRNFLTAETISHDSMPDDLIEIEQKLRDLEAEFYRSNLQHVNNIDREDDDSENGSVCESCLNYDREFEGEVWSDVSSVGEVLEMVDECEVMVPEEFQPEKVEEDCKREKIGKRRRRWCWRTVVILMPASVVWAVCYYFDKKQREGFMVPT